MITKVNPYGHISLTNDYFSGLVEQAAKQCYGIAAMGQAPAESVVRSALRTGSLPPRHGSCPRSMQASPLPKSWSACAAGSRSWAAPHSWWASWIIWPGC